MSSGAFISICIPVYNMQDCIVRAIESALAQQYDNFEVLVIDNRSTDETYARASAVKDDRLRIVQNDSNLGAYGNHNQCLTLARGEWIKFLHGDDELLPNCLAEFAKVLPSCPNDIALLACAAIRLDENDQEFGRTASAGRLFIMKRATRQLTIQGNMIGTPTMTLIHKERFQKIGSFDRSMEPASDGDAWINLMKNYPSAIFPACLVKLRDDPLTTVAAKTKVAKKFCNQIFRQIDKWHALDSEQAHMALKESDFGTWAVTESFPYWSAGLRYAAAFDFSLLSELVRNLQERKLLWRSLVFFLKKRLPGYNLDNFKQRVWLPEMQHLNVEYRA